MEAAAGQGASGAGEGQRPTPPPLPLGVRLQLAGLTAACAQFAVTAAYRYAPAKELSVYDYAQVIFAAILGFLLFHQVPDALSWAGYAIIFATAVGMFFYNNSPKPAGK